MKRRFLGVPLPIIAIILAVVLVSGAVWAAFLWTASIPSTIQILGGEVKAFQDEACTIELQELDFGQIRAGETTNTITFYLKNTGDDPSYCAMAQSNLDSLLNYYRLYEGEGISVPADPERLALQIGWLPPVETGAEGILSILFPPDKTDIIPMTNVASFTASGVVMIDSELIYYAQKNDTANELQVLTRGYAGTTPAEHPKDSVVKQVTVEAVYVVQPGDSFPVSVYIVADATIARGTLPFTTLLEGKDTAY